MKETCLEYRVPTTCVGRRVETRMRTRDGTGSQERVGTRRTCMMDAADAEAGVAPSGRPTRLLPTARLELRGDILWEGGRAISEQ